jgi:arsenite methyltransferase
MPLTCPAEVDLTRLRNSVHLIYARVALEPTSVFSFHRGADYACRCLGYDSGALMTLPSEVTSCFAGVGNPLRAGPLRPGETVADLGCGSGTDLLLAARAVGFGGWAIGIDVNESMRERAERGARRGGFSQVSIRYGDLTDIPLRSHSVDVVQCNSVLYLVPEKDRAIAEIARILRPGGRLHLADVVVDREFPEKARCDVALWAGGIAGALGAAVIVEALRQAGFRRVRVGMGFDCYAGTSHESIARMHGARGTNIFAIRR